MDSLCFVVIVLEFIIRPPYFRYDFMSFFANCQPLKCNWLTIKCRITQAGAKKWLKKIIFYLQNIKKCYIIPNVTKALEYILYFNAFF